ncbi:hypothetical protein [Dictyobacter formicarum]|uniref:Adhesin domain-containing protein n=1 Tax=Dictyobacter formicarum TaxID=2778368 RepID=A0ABQ3VRM5_9CHLR|nr:hypothetical protein [Dictyobacter formicarum]GHO88371.1 hypothetical protein KSZ_63770 [Dictyobacter formicarum]
MGRGRNNRSHNGWHPQDEDNFVENRYIYEDDYEGYEDYEEPLPRPRRVPGRTHPDAPRSRPYRAVPPDRSRRQPPRRVRQITPVRKQRVWPTLLAGCIIGVLLVVGVLALLVILGINSIQNGGHLSGLPGLPSTKPFKQTITQDTGAGPFTSIQVCDKIGNVNLRVDPTATTTRVTALKTVQATDETAAASLFKQVTVEVQPPTASSKALSCSNLQSTPTATGNATTGNANNVLLINVTLPKPVDNQVDLTVTLPAAAIQTTDHPSLAVDIEATKGDVTVAGISGVLKLHNVAGNINVTHAIMADGSQLETGQGNVNFDGFLFMPADAQASARYMLRNESGTITATLPANTNVTLDANTNVGAIHSDFPIPVTNNGGPVNYHGPLNPSAGSTSLATLVLDVSTGDVYIKKAKQVTS